MTKSKSSKKKLIHLNITKDQKEYLDEMGGPTEGFNKIYSFWYQNYEIWEEQEKRKISIKKRLEGLK